jgi:hypothetical protein
VPLIHLIIKVLKALDATHEGQKNPTKKQNNNNKKKQQKQNKTKKKTTAIKPVKNYVKGF